MTPDVAKRVIEGALLCANRPLAINDLRQLFDEEVELSTDTVRSLLDELCLDWQGRSVELVSLASGWRFQCASDVANHVLKLQPERMPRYSRAVMETLAIIAYHQPVTRGDIEEIRGVGVSAHIIKTLEDRGWIDQVGVKEVAGRPALFATTRQFLDDLNLRSLKELPALDDSAVSPDVLAFASQALAPPEVSVAIEAGEAEDGASQAAAGDGNVPDAQDGSDGAAHDVTASRDAAETGGDADSDGSRVAEADRQEFQITELVSHIEERTGVDGRDCSDVPAGVDQGTTDASFVEAAEAGSTVTTMVADAVEAAGAVEEAAAAAVTDAAATDAAVADPAVMRDGAVEEDGASKAVDTEAAEVAATVEVADDARDESAADQPQQATVVAADKGEAGTTGQATDSDPRAGSIVVEDDRQ